MKTLTRIIVGLLLFAVVAGFFPGLVSAEINHHADEVYGCMPDEVAAHLIESGAFSTSGSGIILCIVGYTAVYRALP